ncbi:MAG: cyclomaltodextrinase N-terminal domain-containing protein [Bryobacterales bacterium]|nr:cyclomaltodextrinase N-terminal domain-containing protein [Bryobacterales bacterium]
MRFTVRVALGAALACRLQAAPAVSKVEPPNWWVGHTRNPIQLLLTGEDLKGATLTAPSRGFKVETRGASENGRYLFAYLTVGRSVKPGAYRFQIKNASGTAAFEFRLDSLLDPKGRFQGFSSDDVIYLIMPDRFANGDPANDSPAGLERPADRKAPGAIHGGDLRGVRERLAYLKDLGVTGVWMTPIYRNSLPGTAAYHGYHAVDFYSVEPRLGTMQDLRALVDEAHRMGLKVVQDQVANHSGPRHPFVADPPAATWWNGLARVPRLRNNFDIAALSDPYSRPRRREPPLLGWFAGSLPDFDQTDPLVSDYLIQNALWWIGMTGIDGVRQDTYPYADRPFWEKWQTAVDLQYPNFIVTGEITAPNPVVLSFFQGGVRRRGADTRLKSMLDFPLSNAVRSVFAQGQPMTVLTDVLSQDSLYEKPENLVVFPGNHDQPRFLTAAGGDISKLLMAVTFVLTTRRTVHLYYGDEIAMQGGRDPDNRRDFPGGWPGDPADAFQPGGRAGDAATVFDWTSRLLHFRAEHPALRRGELVQLLVNKEQYAYLRTSPEEHVLVVLDRAAGTEPLKLEVDDLPLPDGLQFRTFPDGSPGPAVKDGTLVLGQPGRIRIYWASRRG